MSFTLSLKTQRYYRIAVSSFFFIMGFVFASWANRIPDIKNMLHLNEAEFGSILFILPIGQFCSMMMAGYLVGRFGSKNMLTIASFCYLTGLICLGLISQVWQLVTVLFFFGMSGNMSGIAANTQGVGVERLYRRSIMASFHGLWSLAGFCGGLVSTLFISFSIQPLGHFLVVAAALSILILFMRRWMMPRDVSRDQKKDGPFFVKPNRFIVTLGIVVFGSMICEGTMFDWSGIYFEKIIHPPKELVRLGYIAFMFTMAGGRFLADWLATRVGITRILQISGITISTGLLLSVAFPYITTATIGFLLVGIGTSSVVPLCYGLAGKSTSMQPSVAIATTSSIGFLGFLIGPPFIGFIAQLSSLRLSFMLIALLGLVTTFMASKITRD